jgi:hypothetical protein
LLYDGLALQSLMAIGADLEDFYFLIKTATISLLEREIDLMVYELYGLSEEEIGVVEGKLE